MRLRLFPALFLLAAACGGDTATATSTPVVTTSVSMKNTSFTPAAIQVSPGAIVTFTNLDGVDHNVTFSSGGVTGSGNFSSGVKSLTMPTAPGTYGYQCTLHAGMSGTVKVQ